MTVTVVWPGWFDLDGVSASDVPDVISTAGKLGKLQAHEMFVMAFGGNTEAMADSVDTEAAGPHFIFPLERGSDDGSPGHGQSGGIAGALREFSSRLWHPGADAPVVLWQVVDRAAMVRIVQKYWRSGGSWVILVQAGSINDLQRWLIQRRIGDVRRRRDLAWLQEPPTSQRSLCMVSYDGSYIDLRVRANLYERTLQLLREKYPIDYYWSDEFE